MGKSSSETAENGGNGTGTLADYASEDLRKMAHADRAVKRGDKPFLCRSFQDHDDPDRRMMKIFRVSTKEETTVHLNELVLNGDGD